MRNLIGLFSLLASLTLTVTVADADPKPSPAPSQSSPVTRRNPSTLWDSTINGHSQISVAEAGRLAFCSGQVAARQDGGPMPRDLVGQAQIVAANLAAELNDLKASPSDIVSLRMYVVNATTDRFLEAWAPIKEQLGGDQPSLTGVGVQTLWTPELQLEVEMVVRVPGAGE